VSERAGSSRMKAIGPVPLRSHSDGLRSRSMTAITAAAGSRCGRHGAQRDKHSSFAISTAEAILYAMRLPIELASDIGASQPSRGSQPSGSRREQPIWELFVPISRAR
jgi:hypothetical protein